MNNLLMNSLFRTTSLLLRATLLALISASSSTQAASGTAVSNTPNSDTFNLSMGGFVLENIRTSMRLDDSGGQVGDIVDFAKTLGGEDRLNVFRADAEWRFAARHRVQAAYFDINMSASTTLNADLNWGDEVYPVNARVVSGLRNTTYKLSYAYSFYRTYRQEIAGQIGAHVTRFEANIGLPDRGKREGASVTAPIPVIGLEWRAKLSEKFFSQVSYQYFSVSLQEDKYSGDLSDFLAVMNYRLGRHWYIGGGYNYYVLNADLKSSSSAVKLVVKHEYNGFIGHVGARF